MFSSATLAEETGLQVSELSDAGSVASRPLRPRDAMRDMEGMSRLAEAFSSSSHNILQVLVDLAIDLCDADSAGISVVRSDGSDDAYYEWVATSGRFHAFMNAVLPRHPSACGLTLDRGRPQHFLVDQRFYSLLGVTADPILDGLLLPWKVGNTVGTIFVVSHTSERAFDANDARVMQILADFAATAVLQQKQQTDMVDRARDDAAGNMAHRLAHRINNPLQSLTNTLFLLQEQVDPEATSAQARMANEELGRLSGVVRDLLAVYCVPSPDGSTFG